MERVLNQETKKPINQQDVNMLCWVLTGAGPSCEAPPGLRDKICASVLSALSAKEQDWVFVAKVFTELGNKSAFLMLLRWADQVSQAAQPKSLTFA